MDNDDRKYYDGLIPPKVKQTYDTLPDDAMFPVPPVCTAYWDDASWVKWWEINGSKRKEEE